MLIRFTKNPPSAPADLLTCVRPDGSSTSHAMPRQALMPHEAFHFVIESALEWHDAFFGHVARGSSLDEITALLHGERAAWSKNIQGLQAESLVEALQAEQWTGPADPAAFAESLILNCRRRGVPPPDIDAEELNRVRVALREFGAAWRPLAPGGAIERTF
jgi:hypothetical protein